MPLVVGLTGGIGSGKSTVAKLFGDLGVPTISADQLARDVVKPGSVALHQIAEHFGNDLIGSHGELDRAALRDRIFRDEPQRLWLENLLHPLIAEERSRQIAANPAPYVLIEIPLLLEKELTKEVDRVLVVDIPESQQIARVTKRDGVNIESVQAIMDTQVSSFQRRAQADDLIDNTGDPKSLVSQVERLNKHYLQLASQAD